MSASNTKNESSSSSSQVLAELAGAFATITDPRAKRGVRHPFAGMLAIVFLGMLGRIREMAVLERWATAHWDQLAEPLGFDRPKPPCDTTFSRTLAGFSIDEFRQAFSHWIKKATADFDERWAGAIDGKTAKQSFNGNSDKPIHMLNVFLQNAKMTLDQWNVQDDKTNEPSCLQRHAKELFEMYPMLNLLTGDAIFAQRPLIEVLRENRCDYLFQVKGNQKDVLESLYTCFADAAHEKPQHTVEEKRGTIAKRVSFGSTWTTPSTFATS